MYLIINNKGKHIKLSIEIIWKV